MHLPYHPPHPNRLQPSGERPYGSHFHPRVTTKESYSLSEFQVFSTEYFYFKMTQNLR